MLQTDSALSLILSRPQRNGYQRFVSYRDWGFQLIMKGTVDTVMWLENSLSVSPTRVYNFRGIPWEGERICYIRKIFSVRSTKKRLMFTLQVLPISLASKQYTPDDPVKFGQGFPLRWWWFRRAGWFLPNSTRWHSSCGRWCSPSAVTHKKSKRTPHCQSYNYPRTSA